MPHTPQGANGHWEWDGHATRRTVNPSNQDVILRGVWRWVKEEEAKQAPLANATISQVVEWHRPKVTIKQNNTHAIDRILRKVIIGSVIITALSIIVLISL